MGRRKKLEGLRDAETEAVLARAREVAEQVAGEVPEGFVERVFGNPLGAVGAEVHGVYLGKGKPREYDDGKKVETFKLEQEDGGVVEVHGNAQIVTFFEEVEEGWEVRIVKTGVGQNKKKQPLNQYRFWVKPVTT
jgi:hypothetical protein